MDLFWKATAAVLIALILMLVLGKQEKDLSILLAIAVCCITGATAMKILTPVLDFLYALQTLAGVEEGLIKPLLQIVGIGLAAEIVGMICADAGYASLGKNIQILASSLILYLSIPILEGMIELIREILGGL